MIISEKSTVTYGACLDPGTDLQSLLWCGPDIVKSIEACAEYNKAGTRAVPCVRVETVLVSIYTEGEGK